VSRNKRGSKPRNLVQSRKILTLPNVTTGSLEAVASNQRGQATGSRGLHRQLYSQLKRMCGDNIRSPRPPFTYSTRSLDQWMLRALDEEKTGFLNSFIDQASMIHSGRAYQLVGPAALVERTLSVLHNADGGEGFRSMLKKVAINYYCSNFGGAIYLHRDTPPMVEYSPFNDSWTWDLPPVTGLYSTDSTAFVPNYDYVYPYTYDGTPWMRNDFIRIVAMPSTQIETWDVGRCALYRCIHVASLTSALYEHVFDLVMPDSTKGIITIHGMTSDEFLEAVIGSEALNEKDTVNKPTQMHHGGDGRLLTNTDIGDILVLADRDTEIKVQYVTLGRIPEGFFIDSWVRTVLQAFASNIGFALSEFIDSSNSRLIGQSGAEVEANVSRGATKGGNEFIIQLQEKLQKDFVPRTVHFEFSARDTGQELTDVQIMREKALILKGLFEATQPAIIQQPNELIDTVLESKARGQFLITRDEARRYGIEMGVLPSWISSSSTGTDVSVSDDYGDLSHLRLSHMREEARERKAIRELAAHPLGEPVVLYENSRDRQTGFTTERTTVLWDDDNDLARPGAWVGWNQTATPALENGRAKPTFNWRMSEKSSTLDEVIESENMIALRGLFRRAFMAQSNTDGPLADTLGDRGLAEMQARMYEIARLGALDSVGERQLTQNQSANIAATLTETVRRRIKFLSAGGASADGETPDDPRSTVGVSWPASVTIQQMVDKYTDLDERAMVMEERLARLGEQVGNREGLRARMLGIVTAGKLLGARGKRWVAADCHRENDSSEIPLAAAFNDGTQWPLGCGCSVDLLW